jgi:hypothetical protein
VADLIDGAERKVAPVAVVEPVAAAVAGMLAFRIAPFALTVNGGQSYRASRKAIHAALRAARVVAKVHPDPDMRRGVLVECAPADRERIAAIVRETVTVEDLVTA